MRIGLGYGLCGKRKPSTSRITKTPTGLTATVISGVRINLTWTNVDTKGSGVKIERSTDGVAYLEIATVALGIASYSNTGLSNGTKYYYRIRAYKSNLYSNYSDVVNATTTPPNILNYAGGTITTAVAWNAYDLIYLNGNIEIGAGGSLTIAPNTTGSNASSLRDVHVVATGNYYIHAALNGGALTVNGTVSRKIYFTADYDKDEVYGEAGDAWCGLTLEYPSSVNYAVVEYGTSFPEYGAGGGICITIAGVSVTNTEIRYCHATEAGGLFIYSEGNESITISGCEIHHCWCDDYDNPSTGVELGGPGTITITNCISHDNYVVGVANSNSGFHSKNIFILANTFKNCIAYNQPDKGVTYRGAGFSFTEGAHAKLINCIAYNCEFGVDGLDLALAEYINCNFINNTGRGISGQWGTTHMINCILWGNTVQYKTAGGDSTLKIANSAIQGGLLGGAGEVNGGGNINLNSLNENVAGPNFVSPTSSNYHLLAASPMINAGISSYDGFSAPTTDIEGNSRVSTVDIGAYEFQS